jgi:hypothetical protein
MLSLKLRKKYELTVFEKRMWRLSEPKREEVTGSWRKLHNEELHNLYFSSNVLKVSKPKMRWTGDITCLEEKINPYKVLVHKPE